MKQLLCVIFIVSLLVGCASTQPVGILYSGGNFYNGSTIIVDANVKSMVITKTGRACATSVLALVAVGDNSIEAAKRDGMINKVAIINYEVQNVLGVYGTYCTVVKGD